MNEDAVQSVSQLTDTIKYTLNDRFDDIWVSGEISSLSQPQSGHIYLTLKDPYAQLSTVIWRSTAARLKFTPQNGMEVLCRGYIDVYPQRGTFQLIVRSIQTTGEGALQVAFRKLHDRLKSEGLFEEATKKPLPRFARRIAVITSPTGAAVHDFLQVATRRWPHFDFLIVPTKVQGPGAAAEIVEGIKLCGHKNFSFQPDVIVLTRGGGSMEDLWAFNEEPVVRAIHKCNIPIISAVGHEIDVTLSDLVADRRALTPSEAGEIIAPDVAEVNSFLNASALRLKTSLQHSLQQRKTHLDSTASRTVLRQPLSHIRNFSLQVDSLETKLVQISNSRFATTRQYLDHCLEKLRLQLLSTLPQADMQLRQLLAKPVLGRPLDRAKAQTDEVHQLGQRLSNAINQKIGQLRELTQHSEEMLNAFNPQNILNRGYSLTVDKNGLPVVDCEDLKTGDNVETWLGQGKFSSTVDSVSPSSSFQQNGKEKD